MVRRVERSGGLRRPVRDVALDGCAVGVLDGSQPIRDPGLAGGDGLAVASAVGAFGEVLAGAFDFAEVGFAFVGVGGDGEQGDVGGGGVQDEADRLAVGVAVGQGDDLGAVGLGPGLLGVDAAVPDPVVELGEFDVGAVDLVADGGEVLPDRAEFGTAVIAVFQEPGGVWLVRVGAGAGVFAQLGLEMANLGQILADIAMLDCGLALRVLDRGFEPSDFYRELGAHLIFVGALVCGRTGPLG